MAVVDADYNFIFTDVGCQGRISDGGVRDEKHLWKMLTGFTYQNLSHFLCRSLSMLLMTREFHTFLLVMMLFPSSCYEALCPKSLRALTDVKRIFNYRLSRGRRHSENVFGIPTNIGFESFLHFFQSNQIMLQKLSLQLCPPQFPSIYQFQ
jgi:hypothetical protein